jgi:hypothetical protein
LIGPLEGTEIVVSGEETGLGVEGVEDGGTAGAGTLGTPRSRTCGQRSLGPGVAAYYVYPERSSDGLRPARRRRGPYTKSSLGWLRNLPWHRAHQLFEQRSRWLGVLGLGTEYISGGGVLKAGVWEVLNPLNRPRVSGMSGGRAIAWRETRSWVEGEGLTRQTTSVINRQRALLIDAYLQRVGYLLDNRLSSLNRRLLKGLGPMGLVVNLSAIKQWHKVQSDRFQRELWGRIVLSQALRNPEVARVIGPRAAYGLTSSVFLHRFPNA